MANKTKKDIIESYGKITHTGDTFGLWNSNGGTSPRCSSIEMLYDNIHSLMFYMVNIISTYDI